MSTNLWARKLGYYLHDVERAAARAGVVPSADSPLARHRSAADPDVADDDPAHRAAENADRPLLKPSWRVAAGAPLLIRHPLAEFTVELGRLTGGQPTRVPNAPAGAQADLRSFIQAWRWLRHDHADRPGDETLRLLWDNLPGDPSCPDHAVWEHLRVTSALAFMGADAAGPRAPWLFTLGIQPLQTFISEARTARDLWLGSFLLADLSWAAMHPVIERYGPDAVIYPDLRGNPRADIGLVQDGLLDRFPSEDPGTFAALFPATFTAVMPKGGGAGFLPIREVAGECARRVEARWAALAGPVAEWIETRTGAEFDVRSWRDQFRRQTSAVFQVEWVAVEWPEAPRLSSLPAGHAMIGQDPEGALAPDPRSARARRDATVGRFLPRAVAGHFDLHSDVFARTDPNEAGGRGFDYAPIHYELKRRAAIRKYTAPRVDAPGDERGEKCTLCQRRAALAGQPLRRARASGGDDREGIDRDRDASREFWRALDEDRLGVERLCGVCATKRFLIVAHGDAGDPVLFNQTWRGLRASRKLGGFGKVRVPFPSASAIAAQLFLDKVTAEPRLEALVASVVRAADAAERPRTAFASGLPRLAAASARSGAARAFLEIDTEAALFPRTLDAAHDREDGTALQERIADLQRATAELIRVADKVHRIDPPATRVAVLRMDGDRLGDLLLGLPERIGAHWKDVLHPAAADRMRSDPDSVAAGWATLLDAPRLMGPTLHAFITRALGEFAHRIVPWVVEREFGGRLIYAGGDDLLALAPAEDALEIAARLNQILSSAWIVDTGEQDPWSWRRDGWGGPFDPGVDARRFVIPDDARVKVIHPGFDRSLAKVPVGRESAGDGPVDGRWIPMLGRKVTLSAGIVYAHFKTPMRGLLRVAAERLDSAKKAGGGVGLSHFSRGGAKSSVVLRWAGAERAVREVTKAFREKRLPKRLPYKLKAIADEARVIAAAKARDDLRGLLRTQLDGALDGRLEEQVLVLWESALMPPRRERERGGGLEHAAPPGEPRVDHAVDALLLCRALADAAGDEEDEG